MEPLFHVGNPFIEPNGLVPMAVEDNEASMGLLQVLYVNMDRANGFKASRIAKALEFEEETVVKNLTKLSEKGLVEVVPEGYRITSKGYDIMYQREASYCPHL